MIPNAWTKPCDSSTCVEVAQHEGMWLVRDSARALLDGASDLTAARRG